MDWKRIGKKLLHILKIIVIVLAVVIVSLSLSGTVAHASGLVDDTINAENLYSKYPLMNYQLDFYVYNSWGLLELVNPNHCEFS